jgi:DNA-binding MarR family transcriptional regulator
MNPSEQEIDRLTTPRHDEDAPTALVKAVGDFAPVWFRWLRGRLALGETTWSQIRALGVLAEDGSSTMSDLAEALDVTPRSVTTLVDALESAGHVRRTEVPADRRVKRIVLTRTGEEYCTALLPRSLEEIGGAFNVLDDKDQAHLLRILRILTRELPDLTASTPHDAPFHEEIE